MATARPTVTVQDGKSKDGASAGSVPLPAVFSAPIRMDIVKFVFNNMNKNHRQAQAVNKDAGHQHSAESWGTGRAVSRIPRIASSGTHRSGQGAFGNMCRKGRMFAPTKTWRRWHRKINQNQRRYAVASALAASAVPALVMARGHSIDKVSEVPLVLDNINDVQKTRDAVAVLQNYGAQADVERAANSRQVRRGKGKRRNRRYTMRRGPLVIYAGEKDAAKGRQLIELGFRNLPGVELCHVDRLNLLKLAPGGHLGRFCVWTKDAFERLTQLFGEGNGAKAELKSGYTLPRPTMANADVSRILNSTEVQSILRPKQVRKVSDKHKKNPLRNKGAMAKLDPFSVERRRRELLDREAREAGKAGVLPRKTKEWKGRKAASKAFIRGLLADEWTK